MKSAPLVKIDTDRLFLKVAETCDAKQIVTYLLKSKNHLKATSPIRSDHFYSLDYWINNINEIQNEYHQGKSLKLFVFHKKTYMISSNFHKLTSIKY